VVDGPAEIVAVSLVFTVAAALIVTTLLRYAPTWWWLLASAIFAALPRWGRAARPGPADADLLSLSTARRPALTRRLLRSRSGPGRTCVGVFEWQLGDRTRKANAR
jgi:hypothetical protein